MTGYQWLVLGHVLAGIAWVGGGFLSVAVSRRIAVADDDSQEKGWSAIQAWLGTRFFGPAAIATLLFGILLVVQSEAWSFGQTWVWLALVLVVASVLNGALYYGPEAERLEKIAAERGTDDPGYVRRLNRVEMVEKLEIVLFVVVVFLMVFKPGA